MDNTSVGRLWAQGVSATIADEEEKRKRRQIEESKTLGNNNTPVAGTSKAVNNYKQQVLDGIGQQGQTPSAQSVGGKNELV